jgi:hypothetical protein
MKLPACRALVVIAVMAVSACSQQGGGQTPNAQQQAATAKQEAAARSIATYRQLLRIPNDEMAVQLGNDIIKRYPDSDAAKEVQKTLPDIEKRYKRVSEERRLAGLWLYQVSPMAGGTQSTATIYSSQPSGNDRVRLVLRRHTSWGQSVFLYGNTPGFVCRGNCTVPATVDGKAVRIKAFAPSTGEPALMIRDDKSFIKMLQEAKKISLDVTLVKGEKKQTLLSLLSLVAGCAGMSRSNERNRTERQAAYVAAAGAPVSNFTFTSLYSWEPLGETQLVVYTRPSKAWLLDLMGCQNLQSSNTIGLTSNLNQVSVRFDKVLTEHGVVPCTISDIRPVDLKGMKAAAEQKREIRSEPRPAAAG